MAEKRTRRIRRPYLVLACVVVAAMIGWGSWLALHQWRISTARNVSEVRAGVLYHSGQPEGDVLVALRDRYHIRTVISLNRPSDAEVAKAEEDFYRANGIRFIRIREGRAFTKSQADQFLVTVQDPSCQPVLVHCEQGRDRSGYAVAYYRIAVEHWTFEAAIAEARENGFPERSTIEEVESLRALAAGRGS